MPDYKLNTSNHINNLVKLGVVIQKYLSGQLSDADISHEVFQTAINKSCVENGFFTESNIFYALRSIAMMLDEDNLLQWISRYSKSDRDESNRKTIGVVMAGNIPLVGFHDFLCVLISGNKFLGKLSHNDSLLLPALAQILIGIDSRYQDRISFTKDKIQGFDAVIATGSNNTSRYFEYYFGKYPHIIRKNRSSIAIIKGDETFEELCLLTEDMFMYFGLGCRNVSKIFVPTGYNFLLLTEACKQFADYIHHNNFRNNYDYYKTIFLMNNQAFIDGGFYILQENQLLHNPVSVFHYEYYSSISDVLKFIEGNKDNLQCIAGKMTEIAGIIPFGMAQKPQLWDYADNIDTLEFLFKL
jgi:hypothetical protein